MYAVNIMVSRVDDIILECFIFLSYHIFIETLGQESVLKFNRNKKDLYCLQQSGTAYFAYLSITSHETEYRSLVKSHADFDHNL